MLSLNTYRWQMPLLRHRLLSRRWTRGDSPIAPVIADAGYGGIVDDRLVVHIVDDSDIYVVHCAVIKKASILPISTFIAHAEIAESVNDSAVKTNFRTPKPLVENEDITAPTPPTGGPEETDFRCQHP